MNVTVTYKTEDVCIRLSPQEKSQLKKIAIHYGLSSQDLIRALIKREALKVL